MDGFDDKTVEGIIGTIDSASKQRYKLNELMENIQEAQDQVNISANTSRQDVEIHFQEMKTNINKILKDRENELLSQISNVESEALEPLVKCKEMIQQSIELTIHTLDKGKKILSEQVTDPSEIKQFIDTEEKLNSLPAVPTLSEVICMYAELPSGGTEKYQEDFTDYGRVVPQAPVQIMEILERPAAQLVKWNQLDDEHTADMTEFRLQFCPGDVLSSKDNKSFKTVYEGPLTCYTVRHLKLLACYSFRVCGKCDGGKWSPWCVPTVANTRLQPYAWDSSCKCYICSNDDKISLSDDNAGAGIQYCGESLYECGHSIVFKIVDIGKKNEASGNGIALILDRKQDDTVLMKNGALLVNVEGCVFLNGRETTTKLPPLARGSSLSFETEQINSDKIRVTIVVNHKAVTLDWTLDPAPKTPTIQLYYAMKFSKGWKVGVE